MPKERPYHHRSRPPGKIPLFLAISAFFLAISAGACFLGHFFERSDSRGVCDTHTVFVEPAKAWLHQSGWSGRRLCRWGGQGGRSPLAAMDQGIDAGDDKQGEERGKGQARKHDDAHRLQKF